jgi:hypothetical protein
VTFCEVIITFYQRTLLGMSANQKRHYLKSYNNVAKLKMTHEFEIQVQICGSVKLVNRIPPPT